MNRFVASRDVQIDFENLDQSQYREFIDELNVLEELKDEYLREVAGIPSNEQLIKTLIRFYERKIKILERLNREIEKQEHDENRNIDRNRM